VTKSITINVQVLLGCASDHLRLMAMIEMEFDLFIFKLNVTDGPAAEHNVAVPLSEPDQASRL
jgi:hypothetical protein